MPSFEESSETVPWPSMSEPSQCAFAVRVVAMPPILPHGGAVRIINPGKPRARPGAGLLPRNRGLQFTFTADQAAATVLYWVLPAP
ncbi:hypothetical protein GCM10009736_58630 [Actinomadura bangladeshensis]